MNPKISPGSIFVHSSNWGIHDVFPIVLLSLIHRFSLLLMYFHEMNPPRITNKIRVKKILSIYLRQLILIYIRLPIIEIKLCKSTINF